MIDFINKLKWDDAVGAGMVLAILVLSAYGLYRNHKNRIYKSDYKGKIYK